MDPYSSPYIIPPIVPITHFPIPYEEPDSFMLYGTMLYYVFMVSMEYYVTDYTYAFYCTMLSCVIFCYIATGYVV